MNLVEEREAITLTSQDEKIFAILHRPLLAEKVPAVLVCSGWAGNKVGKFRLSVRLAQELVKRGIAVLRFDYRGSGDSEGETQDVTLEGEVSDALACLQFLAHDFQIDPNRIGLLGRSLGGLIAILAAKDYQQIKSIALWAPVFDSAPWKGLWNSFQSNQLTDLQKLDIPNLPAGIPNLKFLQQFFELEVQDVLHALKNVPILHIEAAQDLIVKEEHGQAYRLARQGIENTRFVQLSNSGHDFSDAADQQLAIEETCKWFETTL